MNFINTERLNLKPCDPSEEPDFRKLELDPEVMRFLNGGSVDHQKIDAAKAPFLMPRGTEPYVWTARWRQDGTFVGWFSLKPISSQSAELGYRLRRADWGKGLATEGALGLLRWGARNMGYRHIVASTMAVNRASRRVMEKIGMTHVATDFPSYPDPIPGSEYGEVHYAAEVKA